MLPLGFDLSPLWISLRTSLLASVIAFVLGVAAARLFLNVRGWGKWLLDVVFTLPLVLPPTVVGFVLLVLVGRNSPLGRLLAMGGIQLIFSWEATVIAATVVAFPLVYRAAKGAFDQVDQNTLWAARTLGFSELRVFVQVLIPQAWPGIAAGAILAFARALGEFGATLMIAGNIPGATQTIPLAIYFSTYSGDMTTAGIWVAVIIAVSCVVLWLMNRWDRRPQGVEREVL